MKRKAIISLLLVCGIILSLTACSSVPILKGGDFSKEYASFLKTMRTKTPVSVEYEQYMKADGFAEEKLITDTDSVTLQALAEALANVRITEQVEEGSNFAVKYYRFTDENGKQYVFEFFGSFLKAEGKFYQTENSRAFISIRITEKPSGTFLAALDELYDGKGEYAGKRFLSCRILEEKDGVLKPVTLGDYELSEKAVVTAPTSHEDFAHSSRISVITFAENYEQVKGQENANYIFRLTVEKGVITALEFESELSDKGVSIY